MDLFAAVDSASGSVAHLLICATGALALVLVLRVPIRAAFGARLAYTSWTLVPLALCAALLPLPDSAFRLPMIEAVTTLPRAWMTHVYADGPDIRASWIAGWFAGAVAFLLVQLGRQWAFMRKLKPLHATSSGNWTTRADRCSPAVVGVFCPRIVLPGDFHERYSAEEQELVLAHEHVHVGRRDPLVNLCLVILQSLLWFHPLAHLAARYLRVDQELACDATVIAKRPRSRRAYARAILKTQLFGASIVGCAWESQTASFLERRFIMLKTAGPNRSRRRTGAALITLATFGVAGVAWAAQPHPNAVDPLNLAGKRVVILVDGRKPSDPAFDASKIPLSKIERIEVLPASAANPYGPAAADGVINFVMRR